MSASGCNREQAVLCSSVNSVPLYPLPVEAVPKTNYPNLAWTSLCSESLGLFSTLDSLKVLSFSLAKGASFPENLMLLLFEENYLQRQKWVFTTSHSWLLVTHSDSSTHLLTCKQKVKLLSRDVYQGINSPLSWTYTKPSSLFESLQLEFLVWRRVLPAKVWCPNNVLF